MDEKKNIYITTTLPYVNADPHIGFALELIQADVLARLYRILGHKVFFNTGTDEHGQKVFLKAQAEGRDVMDYAEEYAGRFLKLQFALNISSDAFIRTTSPSHEKSAQAMWKRADENGDIYKKKYSGLYCVGCEAFISENDLVNGECQNHPGKKLESLEEENYFFKLSNYQDKLLSCLKNEGSITPDFRRDEAIKFVQNGLEDLSISRLKSKMSWGVPVPGDPEHVMYVWFDALTNYISTLGWPPYASSFAKATEDKKATEGKPDGGGNFKDFWSDGYTIQLAGKDQVRFQSIIWQAMLMSVGEKTTDKIVYHGFITSGGQKMSKSVGNVINPFDLQKEYGTDSLRYYLLRHVHPFDDSDFTEEKFKESYNAHLANGIGNLTSRLLTMAILYGVDYKLGNKGDIWTDPETEAFRTHLVNFEFSLALDWLWKGITGLDGVIADTEPFKLIKTDPDEAHKIIARCIKTLHYLSLLLEPILPETSLKIQNVIEKKEKPDNLFLRK